MDLWCPPGDGKPTPTMRHILSTPTPTPTKSDGDASADRPCPPRKTPHIRPTWPPENSKRAELRSLTGQALANAPSSPYPLAPTLLRYPSRSPQLRCGIRQAASARRHPSLPLGLTHSRLQLRHEAGATKAKTPCGERGEAGPLNGHTPGRRTLVFASRERADEQRR